MKKLSKILISLVLTLCVAFSAGCSFIIDPSNKTPGESLLLAENVSFGTIETDKRTEYTSLKKAVAAVKRSSVAIEMTNSDGTVYGSGTIIDVDGTAKNEYYVLTCHHVVEDTGEITIYVPDENGKNYTDGDYDKGYAFTGVIGAQIYDGKAVTLVGGDKESDVAVLKITTNKELVEAKTPAEDYKMSQAEEIFAIGNPTGYLPGTFTKGYIAYVNRLASISDIGTMTLTQINLDIWHGSSGGSLFNMYGELIGITNAGSDEYSGINYAIPYKVSDDASENGFITIAKQLIATKNDNANNYGYVSGHKSKLGFSTGEQDRVVYVTSVTSGGIAADAGLQQNDVVIEANGTEISSTSVLSSIVESLKIGDTLTLKIQRQIQSWPISSYEYKEIKMKFTQYRFCDTGL